MRRAFFLLIIMLLAACGRAPAAGNDSPLPEQIGSLVRGGGLAGETVFVRLYADGTLIYGDSSGSTLWTA
jgi:hypothetical protein